MLFLTAQTRITPMILYQLILMAALLQQNLAVAILVAAVPVAVGAMAMQMIQMAAIVVVTSV